MTATARSYVPRLRFIASFGAFTVPQIIATSVRGSKGHSFSRKSGGWNGVGVGSDFDEHATNNRETKNKPEHKKRRLGMRISIRGTDFLW